MKDISKVNYFAMDRWTEEKQMQCTMKVTAEFIIHSYSKKKKRSIS
jgi:hypothetical protein